MSEILTAAQYFDRDLIWQRNRKRYAQWALTMRDRYEIGLDETPDEKAVRLIEESAVLGFSLREPIKTTNSVYLYLCRHDDLSQGLMDMPFTVSDDGIANRAMWERRFNLIEDGLDEDQPSTREARFMLRHMIWREADFASEAGRRFFGIDRIAAGLLTILASRYGKLDKSFGGTTVTEKREIVGGEIHRLNPVLKAYASDCHRKNQSQKVRFLSNDGTRPKSWELDWQEDLLVASFEGEGFRLKDGKVALKNRQLPESVLLQAIGQPLSSLIEVPFLGSLDLKITDVQPSSNKITISTDALSPETILAWEGYSDFRVDI